MGKLNSIKTQAITVAKKTVKKIVAIVDARPIVSFFTLLALLVASIVLGNLIRKTPAEKQTTTLPTKTVSIYRIGTAPKVHMQATVEKSGVVTLTALMGGVVQRIAHKEGDHVSRGTNLFSLSTNYQGGNAFSLQRALAQKQYDNVQATYDTQKDLISKQREVADKSQDNANELRDITGQSADETTALINLNSDILSTLDTNLSQYSASNSAGTNNQVILATKQLKSQFQSANNQLNQALRNIRYQSASDKPPAELADLNRDIVQKQLDIQEKALELGKEVSKLQLTLAQVNEATMFPSAPYTGTIQRVLVREGQAVQPGTPLAVLSQDQESDPILAVVYAPREIAAHVSRLETSILHIDSQTYEAVPSFVSGDAVQGTLYAIYFPIPENYSRLLTDKGAIEVELPIGYADTGSTVPFIPLDAVYQSEDTAYLYVVSNHKAQSRQVKLGQVYGRFVEVQSGLKTGDTVILDRNVIEGDKVSY